MRPRIIPLSVPPSGGKVPVSHKRVLQIAVPMTLAYLTTPLLGLVDTAVVGQYGNPALIGGLAVGAIIIDLAFTTFNFLRSGTTGLVSQAHGAGDEKEKQAILFRALLIAVVSGLAVIVASPLLLMAAIWFMAPGEAVAAATSTYFLIRILSAPFALANYVMLGWLLGLGRPGITLALQGLLNGINIVLSILLGLWLGWGISGVAIATIVGEFVACMAGCFVCWHSLDHDIRPSMKRLMDRPALVRLVNLNGDIMLRSFALLFAFAFFTAQGARFGEITLAANAILFHFFLVSGYFLDGLATAAEQIIGQSIGAKHRAGFWRGFKLTLGWSFVMAIICSAAFYATGPWLIALMSANQDVRATAQIYMFWAVLTPLSGVLAFHMDGVFIGATWSRDMTRMMLFSLVIYLATWWITREPLANHGLWLALHVFLVARGISLASRVKYRASATFIPS